MGNLKIIESAKMDFHPDHRLTEKDMAHIQGGTGCICYNNPFMINDGCACDKKAFGLCTQVNGGGACPGNCDNYHPSNIDWCYTNTRP